MTNFISAINPTSSHDEDEVIMHRTLTAPPITCHVAPMIVRGTSGYVTHPYSNGVSDYVKNTSRVTELHEHLGKAALYLKILRWGSGKKSLPNLLSHISDAIKDSEQILDYDENILEGAEPTDKETWSNAVNFLQSYSLFMYGKHGKLMSKPYIDITNDGGVSIHWDTDKGKFLIIFSKGKNDLAYFFGESKEDNIPFKSAVKINAPVQEIIGSWMTDYLTL